MDENKEKQPNTEKPGIEPKQPENLGKFVVSAENKVAELAEEKKKEQDRTRRNKILFLDVYKRTLGSILAVCGKVEINYETFRLWRRDDAEFAQALIDADEELVLRRREMLNDFIINKNLRALTYYLDRRDPLFKPHSEVETNINPTISMKQFMDAYEQKNDKSAGSGDTPANQKQEGGDSTIPKQPGATDILEKKDEEKPVVKTKAEGAK